VLCGSPWIICEVKNWNKGSRVSVHHHTVEPWHGHAHKYCCCKYIPENELPALEYLHSIVYGIMWMHSGLCLRDQIVTHTKLTEPHYYLCCWGTNEWHPGSILYHTCTLHNNVTHISYVYMSIHIIVTSHSHYFCFILTFHDFCLIFLSILHHTDTPRFNNFKLCDFRHTSWKENWKKNLDSTFCGIHAKFFEGEL